MSLVGNIARGMTATQYGDAWTQGEFVADAGKAVDGNTQANLFAHSCAFSTTAAPDSPPNWWKVDFGDLHVVLTMTIYNRDKYQCESLPLQ